MEKKIFHTKVYDAPDIDVIDIKVGQNIMLGGSNIHDTQINYDTYPLYGDDW